MGIDFLDLDNFIMLSGFFLKHAEPDDIDIIHEIELESHNYPWNRESFEKIIQKKERYINLLTINDDKNKKIIGYICFQFLFDELYFLNITVKKNNRRRGVAAKALKFLIDTAYEKGCKKVVLDVNPENMPAVKLYEKLGFNFSMFSKNWDSLVMCFEFPCDKG